MRRVVFPGTPQEAADLRNAVVRHCECVGEIGGHIVTVCGSHRMLTDAHAVNGLIFLRRIRDRIKREDGR